MKRNKGNLWMMTAEAKVIPTNGVTKDAGGYPKVAQAVMGAGLAKQVAQKWPALPFLLGARLEETGNRVYIFHVPMHLRESLRCLYIITFPTKHHWRDAGDYMLLKQSVEQLDDIAVALGLKNVLVPLVGTGLARLDPAVVLDYLDRTLDNTFTLVEYDEIHN